MATILYFGCLTDITKTSIERRPLPDTVKTTGALRQWLDEAYGARGKLLEKSIRLAINNEFVTEPAEFSGTDEIAFMPPVGGG